MQYKIAHIDNRGTDDQPFGFVYLMHGKSIAGRVGYGSHRDNPDPLAVWACRETPENMNHVTVSHIRDALAKTYPHLAAEG